jgi:septal ring factor EnvC (AmiA/AmiB activator)
MSQKITDGPLMESHDAYLPEPSKYLALAERLEAWSHDERLGDGMLLRNSAAALREAHAELARAEAGMDSYATENQQFHDEIERLTRGYNSAKVACQQHADRLTKAEAKVERLRALLREAHGWTFNTQRELYDRIDAELGDKP